jgi:hypothetical protein
MKPFAIVVAFVVVIGLVFFMSTPVTYAEDSVRMQSYVESLPVAHRHLQNYHPNWQQPCDLGKVRVNIDTPTGSLPVAHKFSKTAHPNWQWPTTVETIQPSTEEYTAQGCPGFVYIEPEVYTK